MTVQIDTTAENNGLRLVNQGTHPSAPSVNHSLLYVITGTNAGLYLQTDDGQKIGPFITGSMTSGGGGRTLIQEVTPINTGTVSFMSIPNTYKKLTIEFAARSTVAGDADSLAVQVNGDSTASNYRRISGFSYGNNLVASAGSDSDQILPDCINGNTGPANSFSIGKIEIIQYANTGFNKQILSTIGHRRDTSSVQEMVIYTSTEWENTSAITQLDFILGSGNYASGSVISLYGES